MARQVFYSYHFKPDSWRVAMVRNIGSIEGNRPATDNDWGKVILGGDTAIENWIEEQMENRSCTVVLIGSQTANRKWINREIVKSWDKGMGVVGIDIHGLLNKDGYIAYQGNNPFDYITHGSTGKPLSTIVKRYTPSGTISKERYAWIAKYLSDAVEEAISIRSRHGP